MSDSKIVSLAQIGKKDVKRVGGKAAGLGELMSLGMNVPPGIVITNVSDELVLDKVGGGLKTKVLAAIEKLGLDEDVQWAVRSSASLEDSASRSFAGLFDSVLNVEKKDLQNAIQKVAESLKGERVLEYCKREGIDPDDVELNIVVQQQIDAEFAGVAFSVDPLSGDPDTIVVEHLDGGGEELVSGRRTPIRETFSKYRSQFADKKSFRTKFDDLIDDITRLEKHFGYPIDVEWCHKGVEFYILQVRPITTLPAAHPITIDAPSGGGKSIVGRRVADRMHYSFLDTGTVYRLATVILLDMGVSVDDGLASDKKSVEEAVKLVSEISSEVAPGGVIRFSHHQKTYSVDDLNRQEVSDVVYHLGKSAAIIDSIHKKILDIVESSHNRIVVVGRDLGHLFKDVQSVRTFIEASLDARVLRRYEQFVARLMREERLSHAAAMKRVKLAEIKDSMRARDHSDTYRDSMPLRILVGEYLFDADLYGIDEIVEAIVNIVRKGEDPRAVVNTLDRVPPSCLDPSMPQESTNMPEDIVKSAI